MQHPDEGMIHSWLDGALSAEEAARVESHVSDCASCAAAVAEARGFIAASSRILTALDDVPRGVLPAVPAKRREFGLAWRAAAAMLIVAGGSLVVMREGGEDKRVAATEERVTSAVRNKPLALPAAAAPSVDAAADGIRAATGNAAAATSASPTPTVPPVVAQRRAESPQQRDMSARSDLGRGTQSAGEVLGSAVGVAEATAPNALRMEMSQVASASDAGSLKVVRIERSFGSRRTVYEIAPSATVTLTETDPTPLSAIVATGSGAAATSAAEQRNANRAQRTAAPMSAEAGKAPPPPPPSALTDSRSAADSAPRAVVGAMSKTSSVKGQADAAVSSPTNTISWTEPKTGKTLALSGNVSVERLQEIRLRIEKERAVGPP